MDYSQFGTGTTDAHLFIIAGEASVMKTTVINTSKEMTAYSDFPPPSDYANFMHNTQMNNYLRLYADRFDLRRHIRFNTLVTNVERASNFDSTGGWMVESVRQQLYFIILCYLDPSQH